MSIAEPGCLGTASLGGSVSIRERANRALRVGPRSPPWLFKVECQQARAMAECGGQSHDPCDTTKTRCQHEAGVTGVRLSAVAVFYLNHRMRNRTSGRVLRGDNPSACSIASLEVVSNRKKAGAQRDGSLGPNALRGHHLANPRQTETEMPPYLSAERV